MDEQHASVGLNASTRVCASGWLVFNVAAAFIDLATDKIDLLEAQSLRLPLPNDVRHHFMTRHAKRANNTFGNSPAGRARTGLGSTRNPVRLWMNLRSQSDSPAIHRFHTDSYPRAKLVVARHT
jgi:hypothetical protein